MQLNLITKSLYSKLYNNIHESNVVMQRALPLFDSVSKTYINYDTPFVCDGNFEVEFNFYITEVGSGNGFFALYSEDQTQYLSGKLNDAGTDYQIKMQSDGVTPGQGLANLADNQAHKANFKLSVDGSIEVRVDDVIAYTSTHNDMSRVIGTEFRAIVGCLNNAVGNETFSHLKGYIWDFKVWINGHKENGELWINDPINKPKYDVYPLSTYKQEPNLFESLDAPYGPEKVSTYITSGGSTQLTSVDGEINVYRVNANSSWLIRKQNTFSKGVYLVDVEYDMTEQWSLQNIGGYVYSHRDSGPVVTTKAGSNGTLRYVFECDADGHSLSVVITSNTNPDDIGKNLRIKKFNIRPLSYNVAAAYNFIESDYTIFKTNSNKWTTDNLVQNGSFSDGSTNWVFANGWSVINGKAKRDGDSVNDGIQYFNLFNKGSRYELEYTTDQRTVGSLIAYVSQGGQRVDTATNSGLNMKHKYEFVSDFTDKLLLSGTNSWDGAVDNVSVKEILNQPILPKSRKFTFFDNIAQTTMVFDSAVPLGLNWKIKVKFSVDNLNSLRTIVGNGDSGAQSMFGIRIDTDGDGGRIRAVLPRSANSLASRAWPHANVGAIEPNVMHTVELSCANGSDFTFIVDNIVDSVTFNDIDTDIVVKNIGAMTSSITHFAGYIADLEIDVDGESIVNMPINGNYQEDRANLVLNTLSELTPLNYDLSVVGYVTNESSDVEMQVGKDSVEIWRNSNTTGQFGWNLANITDVNEYILEFDVEVFTGSGMVQFWTDSWSGRGFSAFTEGDRFKFREKLHNIGRIRFKVADSGGIAHIKFSNIKVWKIEDGKPCARADNFLLSDSQHFKYWKEGKYLGPELITESVWKTPSLARDAWVFDAQTDTWTLTGDGSAEELTFVTTSEQPQHMFLTVGVLAVSGAGAGLSITSANPPYIITDPGLYTAIIDLNEHVRQQFKRAGGVVNATISRPSLRKILELKS